MYLARAVGRLPFVLLFLFGGFTTAESQSIYDTFTFYNDLVFERPVAILADPSGSQWMFVVEQKGVIRTFPAYGNPSEAPVVLDLSDRVIGPDQDIESGLLGLAVHPEGGHSSYIYIYYLTDVTGSATARLSRFTVDFGQPAVADPESEVVLIELDRPHTKHNGGDLHFGPDGYLYASFGDGACCGDPFQNGQDRTNLFSTIIRIDVNNAGGDLPYAIPEDNPFVGNDQGWREEIWAYGLRNPWRFSFHPDTGDIWVGDVGEITYEEVNRIIPGGNYGWSIMEGPDCLEWPPGSGQGTNCDPSGLIPPVWAYGRDVGVSVTGGIVYRGNRRPDMLGRYIFADWGMPSIWAATLDEDGHAFTAIDTLFSGDWPLISAFGEDPENELVFLAYFAGRIYRFITSTEAEPPAEVGSKNFELVGPNPFRAETSVRIECATGSHVKIEAFDLLGRRVAVLFDNEVAPLTSVDIPFDGSGLAPGVYVLRLLMGGESAGSLKVTRVP